MQNNTVSSTLLATLAMQGQLDIWKNGFGITAPVPDTAALILQPQNLLTGPVLSSYVLANLTLDENSITNVAGQWSVEQQPDTGLSVAALYVNLPVTPNTQPVGSVLYNKASGDLFYISAFPQFPSPLGSTLPWNVQIVLGTCVS